jgi:hypothetical protein
MTENEGTYDLRSALLAFAQTRLNARRIAITGRFAGTYALDFALRGVNKTKGIRRILQSEYLTSLLGTDVLYEDEVLVGGDKFNERKGGTDSLMSRGFPKNVVSMNVRKDEDPSGFPKGYNIVFWQGQQVLHHGLEEFLSAEEN